MSTWAIVLIFYNVFVIFYFIGINGIYLLLVLISWRGLRDQRSIDRVTDSYHSFRSEFYKPLSVIIPAYNEEATIAETAYSALALRYPEFEIIVVNDGSRDQTLEVLKEKFNLDKYSRDYSIDIPCGIIHGTYRSKDYPNLVVVDKENGGKSDALNAGINVSQFPLFCNIDSDSLIDPDSLLKVVDLFAKDWRTIAAGGTIRAANDCRIEDGKVTEVKLSPKFWVRFQIVEYMRAFLFGRAGWSAIGGLMILSGAFSIYRRKAVVKAGGYRLDTVGEDMELVLRVQRVMKKLNREYRVVFLPDPVCWTQVPESYRGLQTQRRRWQRGLAESLFGNFEIFLNPQYGSTGMISYPFFIFYEFLGPVIEITGYLVFLFSVLSGLLNPPFVILFLTAAVLLGILLSTSALLMEEIYYRRYGRLREVLILFVFAVAENFFYRQLHAWWRFRGIIDLIFKKRTWGTLERQSFTETAKPPVKNTG